MARPVKIVTMICRERELPTDLFEIFCFIKLQTDHMSDMINEKEILVGKSE